MGIFVELPDALWRTVEGRSNADGNFLRSIKFTFLVNLLFHMSKEVFLFCFPILSKLYRS